MTTETERLLVLMQFEADRAEKQAKRMERQVAALERRFDPLGRATQRFNRDLKALENSFEAGLIDQQRYQTGLRNIQSEFDNAARSAGQMGVSGSGLTSIMSRNRSMFQQVGYQVGDFAVQVQGGTSALTAFTQQGSQLLGVFGAYGAIAGAALAVGAPLIASFLDSGEAAKTYESALEDLRTALTAYRDAAELARGGGLADQFGSLAEGIRPALELLENFALVDAVQELQGFAETSVALEGDLARLESSTNRVVRNALRRLSDEFGITAVQALDLRNAIKAIGEAGTPREVAEAARELNQLFAEVFGTVDQIPSAFVEMARQAAVVEVEAARLNATVEDANMTAMEMVDALFQAATGADTAAAAADGLAASISKAAKAAWDYAGALGAAYAQRSAEHGAKTGPGRGGDPTKMGGSFRDWNDPRNRLIIDPGRTPTRPRSGGRRRGGGGGGGGRTREIDYTRELTQLQRRLDLLGKTTVEAAALETRWRLLDEAKRQGIEVDDAVNMRIEKTASDVAKLTDELEKGRVAQENFEQGMRGIADGLAGAIVQGNSLKDVLVNLGKQLAQRALSNLFMNGLSRGLGGVGARLFGTAAPAATGLLRARQMPSIAPSPVLRQRATAGGAQQVEVQVVGGDLTVGDDGKVMARMQVIAGRAAAQGVADVRRNFGSMSAKFQRDGVL